MIVLPTHALLLWDASVKITITRPLHKGDLIRVANGLSYHVLHVVNIHKRIETFIENQVDFVR